MNYLKTHRNVNIALFLLALTGATWFAAFDIQPKQYVTVTFLDVGEGDATLIQGRNGNQILIDGGPDREALVSLSKAMPYFDRTISAIIELSDNKANTTGIPFIMEEYPPEKLFTLWHNVQSTAHIEIMRKANKNNIPIIELTDGMKIDLRDGSYIRIFGKVGVYAIQYTYRNTCVFIAGDMTAKAEAEFLRMHTDISCQVLKVAHHGAKTGTSDMFLSQMKPSYAILSNSKENRYSYPDQEVLDRLKKHEVAPLQTFESGTIHIILDGKNIVVK